MVCVWVTCTQVHWVFVLKVESCFQQGEEKPDLFSLAQLLLWGILKNVAEWMRRNENS